MERLPRKLLKNLLLQSNQAQRDETIGVEQEQFDESTQEAPNQAFFSNLKGKKTIDFGREQFE